MLALKLESKQVALTMIIGKRFSVISDAFEFSEEYHLLSQSSLSHIAYMFRTAQTRMSAQAKVAESKKAKAIILYGTLREDRLRGMLLEYRAVRLVDCEKLKRMLLYNESTHKIFAIIPTVMAMLIATSSHAHARRKGIMNGQKSIWIRESYSVASKMTELNPTAVYE